MHKETDSAIRETSQHSYSVMCDVCKCVRLHVLVCSKLTKLHFILMEVMLVFVRKRTHTSTHMTEELEKETDTICEDRT